MSNNNVHYKKRISQEYKREISFNSDDNDAIDNSCYKLYNNKKVIKDDVKPKKDEKQWIDKYDDTHYARHEKYMKFTDNFPIDYSHSTSNIIIDGYVSDDEQMDIDEKTNKHQEQLKFRPWDPAGNRDFVKDVTKLCPTSIKLPDPHPTLDPNNETKLKKQKLKHKTNNKDNSAVDLSDCNSNDNSDCDASDDDPDESDDALPNGKTKDRKKKPKCTRCFFHIRHPENVKGHKKGCYYKDCICERCKMLDERKFWNEKVKQLKKSHKQSNQELNKLRQLLPKNDNKGKNPTCFMCYLHGHVKKLKGHKRKCEYIDPKKHEPCHCCEAVVKLREIQAYTIKINREIKDKKIDTDTYKDDDIFIAPVFKTNQINKPNETPIKVQEVKPKSSAKKVNKCLKERDATSPPSIAQHMSEGTPPMALSPNTGTSPTGHSVLYNYQSNIINQQFLSWCQFVANHYPQYIPKNHDSMQSMLSNGYPLYPLYPL